MTVIEEKQKNTEPERRGQQTRHNDKTCAYKRIGVGGGGVGSTANGVSRKRGPRAPSGRTRRTVNAHPFGRRDTGARGRSSLARSSSSSSTAIVSTIAVANSSVLVVVVVVVVFSFAAAATVKWQIDLLTLAIFFVGDLYNNNSILLLPLKHYNNSQVSIIYNNNNNNVTITGSIILYAHTSIPKNIII